MMMAQKIIKYKVKIIKTFETFSAIFEKSLDNPPDFSSPSQTKPKSTTKTSTDKSPKKTKKLTAKEALLKVAGAFESGEIVAVKSSTNNRQYDFYTSGDSVKVWVLDSKNIPYKNGKFSIDEDTVNIKFNDGGTETLVISTSTFTKFEPVSPTAAQRKANMIQTIRTALARQMSYAEVSESTAHRMLEALAHYIISNNLSPAEAQTFMKSVVDGRVAAAIASAFDLDWSGLLYNWFSEGSVGAFVRGIAQWTTKFQPEEDIDNQTLMAYGTRPLASYTPKSETEAKSIALAIFNVIDDDWVSADEEANAGFAFMMLSKPGFDQVRAAWKKLIATGEIKTNHSEIADALQDQFDNSDAGRMMIWWHNVMMRSPNAAAITYLNSWQGL